MPLYYWSGDMEKGDTSGNGIKGLWTVAKPDGPDRRLPARAVRNVAPVPVIGRRVPSRGMTGAHDLCPPFRLLLGAESVEGGPRWTPSRSLSFRLRRGRDQTPPSRLELVRVLYRNPLELWGEPSYNQPWVHMKGTIEDTLIVNDPGLVRHVLVDNVKNYRMGRLGRTCSSRSCARAC